MRAPSCDEDVHAVECGVPSYGPNPFRRTAFLGIALLPTEIRRLKQLEDKNNKLKCIVADLSLDKEMLQDVICRKI